MNTLLRKLARDAVLGETEMKRLEWEIEQIVSL